LFAALATVVGYEIGSTEIMLIEGGPIPKLSACIYVANQSPRQQRSFLTAEKHMGWKFNADSMETFRVADFVTECNDYSEAHEELLMFQGSIMT
jgi:hypothetical protein